MKAKTFCAKKVSERNRKGYWLKEESVLNKPKYCHREMERLHKEFHASSCMYSVNLGLTQALRL